VGSRTLVATKLSFSFAGEDGPREIFRDLSISCNPGTVTGILGPNGSGKTTLLRVLAGTLSPVSGSISIRPSATSPDLAIVPQDYRGSFFPWASMLTNIRIAAGGFRQSRREYRREIRAVAAELGLESLDLRVRPGEASGGMVQQAALIRAFQRRPEILLADEPFSALDYNVAARVRVAFRRLVKESATIALVILHSLQDLVELCDQLLVIPSSPFSTEDLGDGWGIARVLKNRHPEREAENSGRDVSLVDLAEKLLAEMR